MTQETMFTDFEEATEPQQQPLIQPAPAEQSNLFDKAVLLSITIGSLGTKRKVQSAAVDTQGADQEMIHVSKDLLQSPILDEIRKFDSFTRAWIGARSLPSMFKSGIYLWPITLVVDADTYLTQRSEERKVLVGRFLDVYTAAKADAQARLKHLFNPSEYPTVEKIRSSFTLDYQFIECSTPGRLKSISPELFAKEAEKAQMQWTNAIEEAQAMLATELKELISHTKERMTPGEDGKPKRFKASLIENFNLFLDMFAPRNISDSSELAAIVAQCKSVLTGSDAEKIRNNDQLRESIRAGMASIETQMEAFITSTEHRAIEISTDSNDDSWGDDL